jgi:hypothetical protein
LPASIRPGGSRRRAAERRQASARVTAGERAQRFMPQLVQVVDLRELLGGSHQGEIPNY